MCALLAHIPGEGTAEPHCEAVSPHPDRASAIRPLPSGERCKAGAKVFDSTLSKFALTGAAPAVPVKLGSGAAEPSGFGHAQRAATTSKVLIIRPAIIWKSCV
jgi:hypothetical protein